MTLQHTVSFDYTAQVWDARKGEALYSLRGHYGRLFVVRWGIQPAAVAARGGGGVEGGGIWGAGGEVWGLYTGADDQSVRWWDIVADSVKGGPPMRKDMDGQVANVLLTCC